jgi:Fic family protein
VEEYLGRNTTAYYKVLAETGQGAWNPDRDTTNWVRFMLTAHLRQARTYRQRLRDYEHLWVDLVALLGDGDEDRQLPALMDAAVGLRITRGGYVKILAANGEEISDQSATRDLRELVDRGLLVPQGEKRARIYLGSDRLRVIWEKIREGRPGKDNSDPLDHLVFETLTLEPTFSPSGSPQKI